MNQINGNGSTGTYFPGITGYYGSTGLSGSTGFFGTTGMSSWTGPGTFTSKLFQSQFLMEIPYGAAYTVKCCHCFGSRKESPINHIKYLILEDNPIYKPSENKVAKFLFNLIKKTDKNYICGTCVFEAEEKFLEEAPLDELPLWINLKWVYDKNFEYLKERLYTGK